MSCILGFHAAENCSHLFFSLFLHQVYFGYCFGWLRSSCRSQIDLIVYFVSQGKKIKRGIFMCNHLVCLG